MHIHIRRRRLHLPPMNFRLSLFCLLLLATAFSARSQETKTSLRITTATNEAIPFANVSVLSLPDSVTRWRAIADSNGIAVVQLVGPGPFVVRVTAVSMMPFEKILAISAADSVYTLSMKPSGREL